MTRDLTEEVGLWWELLITAKSRGWGCLNFLQLPTPSWIGKCKRPSRLTVVLPRGLVTKGGSQWSRGDRKVFLTHVQDGS